MAVSVACTREASAGGYPAIGASVVRSVCRVPRLLGLERGYAEEEISRPASGCARLRLTHVVIRHTHHRGALIVVSQVPRAGTPISGHGGVRITLAPAPPFPAGCRAPTLYLTPIDAPRLIAWEVTHSGESGNGVTEERREKLYACVPPEGPKRLIGEVGEGPLELVSAGSFIAFLESYGGEGGRGETLHLYDVLAGRSLEISVSRFGAEGEAEAPAAELVALGEPLGRGAESVALDASGDLAWVGETEQSPTQPRQFVLYLRDQHGTRKLAVSSAIANVAFSGSELTWTAAGVEQSAPA